jgi:hypothetical protein
MIYIAIAIVIAAVLFLIDRNHVWVQAWKIAKWTTVVSVAVAVLVGGGLYLYIQWSEARQAQQVREYDQAQAAAKAKALADRWSELNSIEKDVCGDKHIVVYDINFNFPESGEVACTLQRGSSNVSNSAGLPLSDAGCAVVQNKLPMFSCRVAPQLRVVEQERVRRLRVTSPVDEELVTEQFGSLKCGTVKSGEIVTLLMDDIGWVKVRAASGQVGWARARNFEVVP